MRRTALSILCLAVAATSACDTNGDVPWDDTDADTVTVQPTSEMRAQFTALRLEVDSVVDRLRSEVETHQQGTTGDTLEAWTNTYTEVADRRGDLLVKLDELDRATFDEARSVRNDVASELADLEADVVRQKLRLDRGDQASHEALDEHLARLEQNLNTIESRAGSIRGATAQRQDDATRRSGDARDSRDARDTRIDRDRYDHIPDMDEIRSLRSDLQEARRDAGELRTATRDDRRDRIDDVSDRVSDLTRQVREHWYNVRYHFTAPGMQGQSAQQGTGQGTQY